MERSEKEFIKMKVSTGDGLATPPATQEDPGSRAHPIFLF